MHGVSNQTAEKVNTVLAASERLLNPNEKNTIKERLEYQTGYALETIHLAAAVLDPQNQASTLHGEKTIDGFEFIYNVAADMHLVESEVMDEVSKQIISIWKIVYLASSG